MKNERACITLMTIELRKQKEGGPIGMDITGEIAKIFMVG